MRYLLSGFGIAATLVLMAVSASMNWSFQHSQGQSDFDANVLGAASIGVDILKSLVPFFIVWAWSNRKVGLAVLGSIGFCLFFAFSLLSALGFNAANRSAVTGSRDTLSARYNAASRELLAAQSRLQALGSVRPISVIEEAIAKTKQDWLWTSSKSCEDATAEASRAFCKQIGDLRIALAASREAAELSAKIESDTREMLDLKQAGAGKVSDPQANLVAKLLPSTSEDGAKLGLNVFMAVLIEFGAAFGLVLSTGFGFSRRHRIEASRIDGDIISNAKLPEKMKVTAPSGNGTRDEGHKPRRPLRIGIGENGSLVIDD